MAVAAKRGFCGDCAMKSKAKCVHLTRMAFVLPCRQCGRDTIWVDVKKK